ncbi:MAG: hypothetical protein H7Z42_00560, partial [Roseiflexaceae bacterium]|nr:hypothetical protein [Roseiflexaceae bacterium]
LAAAGIQALGPDARLLRSGPPIPQDGRPLYLVYGRGPGIEAQAAALVFE